MAQPEKEPEKEVSRPLKVIQTISRPIAEAQKYFYKEHPKEFLEFLLTAIFITLVLVAQTFVRLPLGLYVALSIWIICYFRLPENGYRLAIKIKKHKMKGKK